MMQHVVAEFEARGWSLTEFLRTAQMRRVRWDALIESGGRVMSPDDADCLARAFGTSAELWRNLAARADGGCRMIDKNQIETWRSVQRKRIGPGGNGLAVLDAYQVEEVLTDYLAMREIVEALAANEEMVVDVDTCLMCPACGASWDLSRREGIPLEDHNEGCFYVSAVALIGPASQREAGLDD